MALIQNLPKEPPRAFELKGRMMAFSVLRVLTADLRFLVQQLDAKIAAAPHLFQHFPVLLDFEALPPDVQEAFDIARLDRLLRERSFVPVGMTGAGDVLRGIAAGVGIGTISAGLAAPSRQPPKDAPAAAARVTNLLIKQPVRSGQQVYARGGDLTVLATVSPGAEVMADGNVHIWLAARPRACRRARQRGGADLLPGPGRRARLDRGSLPDQREIPRDGPQTPGADLSERGTSGH